MIKIKFELITEKENFKEERTLIDEREFPQASNWFDSGIDDYIYHKVLELNGQYDFVNYEEAPYIEISYLNEHNIVVKRDDCIDYYMNL